ncbi:MAG: Crp/Fnr family transcriptional regulator [Flavipsychrobacter sp.]|jgi:CRP-like cAMP-binding protein|nr:Crp/Fnr family transcriptional regulator [Flavipsychrobacter sp.]
MSLKGIFPIDRWDFSSRKILTELNDEDRESLMSRARKKKYKKAEIVFREGAEPAGIFYIESGTVKKYKTDNAANEHIFYVASAGELIGYHAVLAGEPYPDAAAALEDSVIRFVPLEDFLSCLERSPVLSRILLKTLSHEFAVFVNNLSVSAQRPVRERIAIVLIVLREKFKKGVEPGAPVMISISRDDIANMAGTTRENVARFLTEFKQEEIIETVGRKILITDIKKLATISNYS